MSKASSINECFLSRFVARTWLDWWENGRSYLGRLILFHINHKSIQHNKMEKDSEPSLNNKSILKGPKLIPFFPRAKCKTEWWLMSLDSWGIKETTTIQTRKSNFMKSVQLWSPKLTINLKLFSNSSIESIFRKNEFRLQL